MTESNDSPPEGIDVDQAFVCDGCGRRWYYTRSRCPGCGGRGISTYRLGRGELLAVTDIAVTPPDVRSPNRVGLARFGDVQLIAQLQEDASVGDTVVFAGEYRLRDGDESTKPRLQSVD
jgi:uncharacterized OB-fold protein